MPDRIPFYGLIEMYRKGGSYPKIDFVKEIEYGDAQWKQLRQQIIDKTHFYGMGQNLPGGMSVGEFTDYIMLEVSKDPRRLDDLIQGLLQEYPGKTDLAQWLSDNLIKVRSIRKVQYEGNLPGIPNIVSSPALETPGPFNITGVQPSYGIESSRSKGYLYFPGLFPNAVGFYMSYYAGHSFYIPDGWGIDDQWTNKRWSESSNWRYRYLLISHQNIADYPVPGYRYGSAWVKYAFPCLPFLAYVDGDPEWFKAWKPPFDYDIKRDGKIHYLRKDRGVVTIFDWVDYAHDSGLEHPLEIQRRL